MEQFEFILEDRKAKIQAMNEQYDLEQFAYISFSGGKDSVVLSRLIDEALPNNKIPRVYFNTGIEYKMMVDFVKGLAEKDDRFQIIPSGVNIKKMLEENGYPFKSKQHSHNLAIYWRNKDKTEYNLSLKRYLGIIESSTKFRCPAKLRYQFTKDFNLHCSDMCCYKLKKEPAHKYEKTSGKTITLTGMRSAEGGQRASIGCIVTDKDKNLKKFHPLLVVDDGWENQFIERYNVELCKLYKAPYNFVRTGCVACSYALNLQEELDRLYQYLPSEYWKALKIWKPVYDEYIRIGYRLKYYPHERGIQMSLDDFMEE